jgi:hypothetical protein
VKRKIKIEWVGKKDCSTTIDLHFEHRTSDLYNYANEHHEE